MSEALKDIQNKLRQHSHDSHVDFSSVMVPGVEKIYGVKTPVLNQLVKKYSPYSFDLVRELWASGALEERIIAIKIVEKIGKGDPGLTLKLFLKFSKDIDNWAVCDGLGMQFLRGIVKTHYAEILAIAKKISISPNFWQRRLSLVMLEWYTRKAETHKDIVPILNRLSNDKEYYVKKAVVWITRNLKKGK